MEEMDLVSFGDYGMVLMTMGFQVRARLNLT